MNHHTAAQKGDGGGWHYVSLSSRGGGYPLGYCAGHAPHETEAEARRCYQQWRRAHVRRDLTLANWGDCSIDGCGEPTKTGARIEGDGYSAARLCTGHLDYDHAIIALGLEDEYAGDSWES